ncbi:glycosyltransferase family 9 protein [Inmirania thermothiophila]|uniref:Heptosyltransferase I n=1 Tax=Inmirania thermothiophila TaxID=1750597 RepID=A0A3N1Y7E8_9GAMM|nr:glycosyltransferase family 9 protein [Inmirania thermothiophila]ROR34749.1 heptosyltransferase I [Inmirania thermothiophila]
MSRTALPLAAPPRALCVLRLSALGDVCHTLAVVRTLQRHWPGTRITWIIGRTEAGLVGDIPEIEFVVVDKAAGPLAAARALARTLRGRRFDVLLHMQAALRASLLARVVQAPVRLGFDRPRAKDLQWLFTNARIEGPHREHVLDGLFRFAEALGVRGRDLRWDIPIPPAARERARRATAGLGPYLVISPCSRWAYRNWLPERYAAVARHALRRGLGVVITGGASAAERAHAAAILEGTGGRAVDLTGRTDLKTLLALLEGAVAVVSPDSGPAHFGTAVGTPVLGLYAATNPDRARPYLSARWTVNRYPEAVRRLLGKDPERVRWGTRVRDPRAMALIPVEAVCERLDALLGARA